MVLCVACMKKILFVLFLLQFICASQNNKDSAASVKEKNKSQKETEKTQTDPKKSLNECSKKVYEPIKRERRDTGCHSNNN